MDTEDDDIYPEHDNDHYAPPEPRMQDVDDEEEGEEVESDDDDIQFITDAKYAPKVQPGSQAKLQPGAHLIEKATSKASPTPTPGIKRELTPQAANINRISTPLDDGKPGTDYLARHTSTLDPMNGNPIHPATGKPILETDLDSDFPSESSKPWRKPGADITDYFNYGFDEFTWASYCLKKQEMPKEVKAIAQEADNMKAMFDMMPGATGMPPMPGMPNPAANGAGAMPTGMPTEEQMQQMMAQMDPNFLAQMMGMPGGAAPGQFGQTQQPPAGPAGFGGGGHQDNFGGRGRGRGRGRNWV